VSSLSRKCVNYSPHMGIQRGVGRRRARMALSIGLLAALVGCSQESASLIVRGADEVQVLSPEEVDAMRNSVVTSIADAPTGDTTAGGESADTVPLNKDDRPAELRLFEAFSKFRSCIEDKGFTIEGDLSDRNNPAYQDPEYAETVQTCAARSDIVTVLQEVQATRSSLTPEEVKTRNEAFVLMRECLIKKGWTVETSTSEIGLIEPTVFTNADGVLDERDINQCLSEQNLGD